MSLMKLLIAIYELDIFDEQPTKRGATGESA